MTLLYADTSAIIGAYFSDEPGHAALRALLLEGAQPVVSSEIALVEMASAIRAAGRGRRLKDWQGVLARVDADCSGDGPIALIALRANVVLPTARRLVLEHRLRTLDAVHVAVAVEECGVLSGDGTVTFVTRDGGQRRAARALGLTVE